MKPFNLLRETSSHEISFLPAHVIFFFFFLDMYGALNLQTLLAGVKCLRFAYVGEVVMFLLVFVCGFVQCFAQVPCLLQIGL